MNTIHADTRAQLNTRCVQTDIMVKTLRIMRKCAGSIDMLKRVSVFEHTYKYTHVHLHIHIYNHI